MMEQLDKNILSLDKWRTHDIVLVVDCTNVSGVGLRWYLPLTEDSGLHICCKEPCSIISPDRAHVILWTITEKCRNHIRNIHMHRVCLACV